LVWPKRQIWHEQITKRHRCFSFDDEGVKVKPFSANYRRVEAAGAQVSRSRVAPDAWRVSYPERSRFRAYKRQRNLAETLK